MFEKKKMIIDIGLYQKAQRDYKNHSIRRLKGELHISTDQAAYLKKCWNDPKFAESEDKKLIKELKKVSGYKIEEITHLHYYCYDTTRGLRKRKKMQKITLQRARIDPKNWFSKGDKPYFYDLNDNDFKCKKK